MLLFLKEIAQSAPRVLVIFNKCHMGQTDPIFIRTCLHDCGVLNSPLESWPLINAARGLCTKGRPRNDVIGGNEKSRMPHLMRVVSRFQLD